MSDRTLEQAFNAVFHNKERFSDFCSLDLSEHVEQTSYKKRQVYKTSKTLRSYLRFIDKVLLRKLSINDEVVHSYVKRKSVLSAVEAHAKNSAFFLTDIESFFSNIGKEDVVRIITRDMHRFPISDVEAYIDHLVHMMTWDGSIPVGFPTSPNLSNGYLLEFDNSLHSYCKYRDLIYTRYADDIIVSSQDRGALLDLRNIVQELLYEHASKRLHINISKTRINHIGNKVKILGLVITPDGRVTMDAKYKRMIESILHFYITDKVKYADLLNKLYGGKEHSLFGLLHYIKATDPKYLDKLQRKYGVSVLHSLMEDRWGDA